ncbi:thymidylate synthase [Gordonia phage Terapin]|uniref:ThyX-like thymidylate synthase n=5 Tax=Terapinvirus terapin TaxID=2734283 RepID=A0A345MBB2_9CAUD|nr:thymidylate synthase [Gordonia phage Terapin]AVP43349.1 ThyX-like thymidylate synthase [Gordonia phage Djokovic]AXH67783.1 ThyX-like thymidylate synthase [Gordonia phage Beyoncage]QOC56217.1 ThyX-like thymidylate synthase [Gordonia phage Sienna]QOC56642.1 ThyX-like thymidylate synthase [Gordonia phage BiteSize]QYW00874.1 ThyX-like thymidylate synthase [Gordonia phage Madi]
MSNESSKAVVKFSDEAMFTAEYAKDTGGGDHRPRVRLLDAPSDPLGKLAFLAKTYQGRFPDSYADISDEDRLYYVQDMEKNILGMPSEAVQFHFLLENVTRSFTHQLVRTRHASYAQESMRFAVKEDFPVQLPPSLVGTLSYEEWQEAERKKNPDMVNFHAESLWSVGQQWWDYAERYAGDRQMMRFKWDEAVADAGEAYAQLIDMGMPAEDARGLAPHAIVTKINWVVDLRALMATAGQRLCTQAQWEHREMWASLIQSIRDYGRKVIYTAPADDSDEPQDVYLGTAQRSSSWQFDFLADRFKPVCYQTGRCQFRSDFDRYCNIRDRVEANAAIGRPSNEWHEDYIVPTDPKYHTTFAGATEPGSTVELGIPAIAPHEWLDPNAAIQPTGDWRSAEAQANIKDRR